jgi:hypothetical protein
MLAGMGNRGLYFELTGFAAARIEVRAFKVVMIPAFAMETVCCSYSMPNMHEPQPFAQSAGTIPTHHNFMQDTPC